MGSARGLLRDYLGLGFGRAFQLALNFAVFAIAARTFSVAETGALNFAYFATMYLVLIANLGIDNWVISEHAGPVERGRPWVRHAVALKFGASVVLVAAAVGLALLFSPGEAIWFGLFGIGVIAYGLDLRGFFDAAGRIRAHVMSDNLRVLVWFAIFSFCIWLIGWGSAYAAALGWSIGVITMVGWQWRQYRLLPHGESTPIAVAKRKMLMGALPLGISALMVQTYFYIDTILLRVMRGEEDVAYYSNAYRVMMAFVLAGTLLQRAILPRFAAAADDEARKAQLIPLQRLLAVLVMAPACGAITFMWVVPLLFGAKYDISGGVFMMLMFSLPAAWFNGLWGAMLMAQKERKYFMYGVSLTAGINLALNLIYIPQYGMGAAALTTVASECALHGFFYWRIRQMFGGVWTATILRPLIAGLFALAVAYALPMFLEGHSKQTWFVLAWMGSGLVSYVAMLIAIKAVTREDMHKLKGALA